MTSDHPICQSEDQGGHPGCHRPATFQSKDVVTFSHTEPLVRMYFCRFHRERFYRLEDTEQIPLTRALVEALESNADFERSELDRYATLHFEQDTAARARLEHLLGLPKTNWWKRVIDEAERALQDLPTLHLLAAYLLNEEELSEAEMRQVADWCHTKRRTTDNYLKALRAQRGTGAP